MQQDRGKSTCRHDDVQCTIWWFIRSLASVVPPRCEQTAAATCTIPVSGGGDTFTFCASSMWCLWQRTTTRQTQIQSSTVYFRLLIWALSTDLRGWAIEVWSAANCTLMMPLWAAVHSDPPPRANKRHAFVGRFVAVSLSIHLPTEKDTARNIYIYLRSITRGRPYVRQRARSQDPDRIDLLHLFQNNVECAHYKTTINN